MPIFEYKCPAGHLSEIIDISNKSRVPSIPCPTCGETADRVLVSRTNWQIGSGEQSGESFVSQGIRRIKKAEREGRLD